MKEYNIEIVGAPGVGKSAYTIRVVQGIFVRNYDPTRQDLYRRKVVEQVTDHSQIQYTINLLDTVGPTRPAPALPEQQPAQPAPQLPEQQVQPPQQTTYIFGQGFVVLFDISREETFEQAKSIILDIVGEKRDKKIPIMLLGNKLDLEGERQVLRSTAVELSDKYSNCHFMESSCKDNTNIMDSLQKLAKLVDKRTGGVVPKDNDGSCVIS